MMSEFDKICQLLMNDEVNAKVALQLLKGRPELKLQVEQEFSEVLAALGKKRLSGISTLFRKFKNQEKLSVKERMALTFYPKIAEKMEVLNLADARLRTLPDCIYRLPNLKELNLNINKIGAFPSSMAKIKSLEKLLLNNNHLTSFPEIITQIVNLSELHLMTNKISTIPASIENLQQLTYLTVSNNRLLQLPNEVSNLKELKELHLGGNKLRKLPKDLGNLTKLKTLNMWGWNNWLRELPESIQRLQNLNWLVLSSLEPIKNLSLIGACCNLEALSLGLSNTKVLPDEIGNLNQLKNLSINGSKNPMTSLPDRIGDLRELTNLELYDNHNLKNIPDTIGNLLKLKSLIIVGHSIPKGRQKEIQKLLPHCHVRF